MHACLRITHRHGAKSIAVIAASDGQKMLFPRLPESLPILDGHLQRDFHRYRSRIGKKHRLQRFRSERHQARREIGCGSVGEPAEHDMGHVAELALQCLVQRFVVVAVNGAPPGRHAVDQFAPVRQADAHTLCRYHRIDRQPGIDGAVRVPHVFAINSNPVVVLSVAHGRAIIRHTP